MPRQRFRAVLQGLDLGEWNLWFRNARLNKSEDKAQQKSSKEGRAARLSAQLRDNLKRRKTGGGRDVAEGPSAPAKSPANGPMD
jgi:hypothetical protein